MPTCPMEMGQIDQWNQAKLTNNKWAWCLFFISKTLEWNNLMLNPTAASLNIAVCMRLQLALNICQGLQTELWLANCPVQVLS